MGDWEWLMGSYGLRPRVYGVCDSEGSFRLSGFQGHSFYGRASV